MTSQSQPLLAEEAVGGTSKYGRLAIVQISFAVALGALAVSVVLEGIWNGAAAVVDPLAMLAAIYVFILFCLQVWFLEWPSPDIRVFSLLFASLATFAGPTALKLAGENWLPSFWPGVSWILSMAFVVSAYLLMVRGPKCSVASGSLSGRISIISGCNTGIGYETAKALAEAGSTVVFACRSEEKARSAMEQLRQEAPSVQQEQLKFMTLDLSSLGSVQNFAEEFIRSGLDLHLLIMNAGVMLSSRTITDDGLDGTMAANHFGHFLLADLLMPRLREAEAHGQEPRIVVVGSTTSLLQERFDFSEVLVHEKSGREAALAKPYSLMRSYGQSKLANLLFVRELARRLETSGSKIPVNCVHPGQVLTEVHRDMHSALVLLTKLFHYPAQLFIKTPRQGSFGTLHVATAPSLATTSGLFLACHRELPMPEAACDEDAARRLWMLSEVAVGIAGDIEQSPKSP